MPSFRMSGRGRAASARRRRVAVVLLGDGEENAPHPQRRKSFVRRLIRRLRLRSLLTRCRRAFARLREYYAEVMRGLIAEAAAMESAKARMSTEAASMRPEVVPAVVAGTVLRCNSHYYVR